ncbi:MAG: hypothetical protein FRX48_03081 [Lasallia pustulata]|uniref:Zinc finger, C2H2-like n=1 Tax=Lasallia pustulata TaxID=136370 RepID=A0A1W5CV78_9LECA|nr:MAG: hypothetical protein FRX48_03081 [Lasallia pustulata]SLM34579.1 Zinc finger, C2H2-like [Lasallia pustulata]
MEFPSPNPSPGLTTPTNNHSRGDVDFNSPTGAAHPSCNVTDNPSYVYQAINLDTASNQWGDAYGVDAETLGYDVTWPPLMSTGMEDFNVSTTMGPDLALLHGFAASSPLYWNDTAAWATRSDAFATSANVLNNGANATFDDNQGPTSYDCFGAAADIINPLLPLSTDGNIVHRFQDGTGTALNNISSRMVDSIILNQPPVVAAPISVPAATNSTSRFRCMFPGCGCTFAQSSDLSRHARKHEPDAKRYECWARGCSRNGKKGFLRRDKLQSHQRNMHGMESLKIG